MTRRLVSIADVVGLPEGSHQRRRAIRVVDFVADDEQPAELFVEEACCEQYRVSLSTSQLAHLIFFLQRRLNEMAEHVEVTSVPIVHLSGCCGWPVSVTINVIDDVTWTTRRCGRCDSHLSTFADAGELDLGVIDQKGNP